MVIFTLQFSVKSYMQSDSRRVDWGGKWSDTHVHSMWPIFLPKVPFNEEWTLFKEVLLICSNRWNQLQIHCAGDMILILGVRYQTEGGWWFKTSFLSSCSGTPSRVYRVIWLILKFWNLHNCQIFIHMSDSSATDFSHQCFMFVCIMWVWFVLSFWMEFSPCFVIDRLKNDEAGISSWDWKMDGQNTTYHALFPRAWTIYEGIGLYRGWLVLSTFDVFNWLFGLPWNHESGLCGSDCWDSQVNPIPS